MIRTPDHDQRTQDLLTDVLFLKKPVAEQDAQDGGKLEKRQGISDGNMFEGIVRGKLHGPDAQD